MCIERGDKPHFADGELLRSKVFLLEMWTTEYHHSACNTRTSTYSLQYSALKNQPIASANTRLVSERSPSPLASARTRRIIYPPRGRGRQICQHLLSLEPNLVEQLDSTWDTTGNNKPKSLPAARSSPWSANHGLDTFSKQTDRRRVPAVTTHEYMGQHDFDLTPMDKSLYKQRIRFNHHPQTTQSIFQPFNPFASLRAKPELHNFQQFLCLYHSLSQKNSKDIDSHPFFNKRYKAVRHPFSQSPTSSDLSSNSSPVPKTRQKILAISST